MWRWPMRRTPRPSTGPCKVRRWDFFRTCGWDFIRKSSRLPIFSWDLMGFNRDLYITIINGISWLVGDLETLYIYIFSISYMGCHPSHWLSLTFFKMAIVPPSSRNSDSLELLEVLTGDRVLRAPTGPRVSTSQGFHGRLGPKYVFLSQ